jgi:hypothetical protein
MAGNLGGRQRSIVDYDFINHRERRLILGVTELVSRQGNGGAVHASEDAVHVGFHPAGVLDVNQIDETSHGSDDCRRENVIRDERLRVADLTRAGILFQLQVLARGGKRNSSEKLRRGLRPRLLQNELGRPIARDVRAVENDVLLVSVKLDRRANKSGHAAGRRMNACPIGSVQSL